MAGRGGYNVALVDTDVYVGGVTVEPRDSQNGAGIEHKRLDPHRPAGERGVVYAKRGNQGEAQERHTGEAQARNLTHPHTSTGPSLGSFTPPPPS